LPEGVFHLPTLCQKAGVQAAAWVVADILLERSMAQTSSMWWRAERLLPSWPALK